MVSNRCKIVVKAEIEKLGLHCSAIELGEADIKEDISKAQYDQFNSALKKVGLELLEDNKHIVVEKIKTQVIEIIYYSEELPNTNFSDYFSERLSLNYKYLSRLFSEIHGSPLSHYIILQKIERAKELMTYNDLNITEIAFKLHYRNVAHLSNQFKAITGLSPSQFKKLKAKQKNRIPIGLV